MGEKELKEYIWFWEGSGECRETRGRKHFLHFWLDSRLEVLEAPQVGSGCANAPRNQLPSSGAETREDLGKEAKMLSRETSDILTRSVEGNIWFLNWGNVRGKNTEHLIWQTEGYLAPSLSLMSWQGLLWRCAIPWHRFWYHPVSVSSPPLLLLFYCQPCPHLCL